MKAPTKKVSARPARKVATTPTPKISAEVRLQALDRAITVHTPFMQRRDYLPDEHIMETARKFAHFIAWGMTK